MKFKEPVKGKGFRNLFRKNGYNVYLVEEFRTSCRCSGCGGLCTKFHECENPRPYRDEAVLRQGLVKCQTCSRLWNRDVNASLDIWKITRNAIDGLARPQYLQRQSIQTQLFSSTSSVVANQDLLVDSCFKTNKLSINSRMS